MSEAKLETAWADKFEETAFLLICAQPSDSVEAQKEIAAALRKVASDKEAEFIQRERKAKADGVLEASRYFSASMKDELPAFKKHMVETFNEMANMIERGEV